MGTLSTHWLPSPAMDPNQLKVFKHLKSETSCPLSPGTYLMFAIWCWLIFTLSRDGTLSEKIYKSCVPCFEWWYDLVQVFFCNVVVFSYFFCNSNMALTKHLYFQISTVVTLVHPPTFNITSIQHVNITLSALKLQSLLFNLKLQLRRELRGPDIFHVGGNVPEVDLAIMASCNASIICESYKWCWLL